MTYAERRRAHRPPSLAGYRNPAAVPFLCLACLVCLVCLLSAAVPPASADVAASGEQMQPDPAGPSQLLSMVNAQRLAAGAAPVSVDERLAQAALEHTLAMGRAGRVWHNAELATAAFHAALGIRIFGENVVGAPGGVVQAERLFLASPHHRQNLLDPRWAVAGFAVVRETDGYAWVTQDFGTAPDGAGALAADRSQRRPLPVAEQPTDAQHPPASVPTRLPVPPGADRVGAVPEPPAAPLPGSSAATADRSSRPERDRAVVTPGGVAAGLVVAVSGAWLVEVGRRLRRPVVARRRPG